MSFISLPDAGGNAAGWLIFFSSLPSKPVGNRVKVWRKLTKSGAVRLKGSVYVLPAGDEQVEFLNRLVAEVVGMSGEAAFVRVERIETVPDAEIIDLFKVRKESDYRAIGERLEALERGLDNARLGSGATAGKALEGLAGKVRRDFEEVRRTDFLSSVAGKNLEHRLALAEAALRSLGGPAEAETAAPLIPARSIDAYRGKRWLTRRKPFVDRMASAWFVRRFVDPGAVFGFLEDEETVAADAAAVLFDMAGGEFTHVGDLCTFEVLLRSFAVKDAAVAKVAEIVHALDVRDDAYHAAEAAGIEEILSGIRRTAPDDADALERGMAVFEMLYAAKKGF